MTYTHEENYILKNINKKTLKLSKLLILCRTNSDQTSSQFWMKVQDNVNSYHCSRNSVHIQSPLLQINFYFCIYTYTLVIGLRKIWCRQKHARTNLPSPSFNRKKPCIYFIHAYIVCPKWKLIKIYKINKKKVYSETFCHPHKSKTCDMNFTILISAYQGNKKLPQVSIPTISLI